MLHMLLRSAGEREGGSPAAGLPSVLYTPDARGTCEVSSSCCHAHWHSRCCIGPTTHPEAAIAWQQPGSAQGACAEPGLRGSANTSNSTSERSDSPSLVSRGLTFSEWICHGASHFQTYTCDCQMCAMQRSELSRHLIEVSNCLSFFIVSSDFWLCRMFGSVCF